MVHTHTWRQACVQNDSHAQMLRELDAGDKTERSEGKMAKEFQARRNKGKTKLWSDPGGS